MVTTIFTQHEAKTGEKNNKPWVLNIFTDQHGQEYQVFTDASGIAAQALELLGTPVDVEYDEVLRGNFTNRVIKSIKAATNGSVPTTPTERVLAAFDQPQIKPVDRNAGLARAIETFATAGVDPLENQQALFELADVYAAYGAMNVKPSFASADETPKV